MATTKTPCCPELPDGKKCDYLDFIYRLTHIASVDNQRIPVELGIHVRLERCTGPLQLGNLVYSTTLLPKEKVRLFTLDRRSRFTFDSESQLSYRHERAAEEQFYMDSYDKFMSDLDTSDSRSSSSSSSGSASSSAGTSGLLGTIVNGPSVSVSGQYNASSTSDFLRELSAHAESSHNRSVEMTRASSSVSIGEVSTRQHAEGESESQLESTSRTFSNPNRCRAVTYLFYQVDKQQTTTLTIQAIRTRVLDAAGDSAVVNRPVRNDTALTTLPAGVLATSDKLVAVTTANRTVELAPPVLTGISTAGLSSAVFTRPRQEPIDNATRAKAEAAVREDLVKQGVLDTKGQVSEKIRAELEFSLRTSIPTPGVVVKGCLDDCETCEPELQQSIKLELERKKLQNELLKRQIEFLPESQEYRCCPVKEEETADED